MFWLYSNEFIIWHASFRYLLCVCVCVCGVCVCVCVCVWSLSTYLFDIVKPGNRELVERTTDIFFVGINDSSDLLSHSSHSLLFLQINNYTTSDFSSYNYFVFHITMNRKMI